MVQCMFLNYVLVSISNLMYGTMYISQLRTRVLFRTLCVVQCIYLNYVPASYSELCVVMYISQLRTRVLFRTLCVVQCIYLNYVPASYSELYVWYNVYISTTYPRPIPNFMCGPTWDLTRLNRKQVTSSQDFSPAFSFTFWSDSEKWNTKY